MYANMYICACVCADMYADVYVSVGLCRFAGDLCVCVHTCASPVCVCRSPQRRQDKVPIKWPGSGSQAPPSLSTGSVTCDSLWQLVLKFEGQWQA